MRVLGISAFYHDSAAALIEDGHLVGAAQEERFTRKKHDSGFPQNAVQYCLDAAGIKLGDVIYQTAYQSAFEDVVPVFAANQAVQATRKGNVMYVTLPGNRTVPMAIAGSTSAKGSSFSN